MNYFIWIFLGLLALILTLYIVFYIKKIKAPKIVFSFLIIPFATAFIISLLNERYPDSLRIIQIQILAALFTEIPMLLQLNKTKNLKFLALLSYLLILAAWNMLYFPTIYLIRIPSWFSAFFIIIMITLFGSFCFITKTKSFFLFLFYAAAFFAGGWLLYTALAELIFSHRLYSLLLTIGSITTLFQLLIYASEMTLISKKYSQPLLESCYLLSFAIVSAAGILMIY